MARKHWLMKSEPGVFSFEDLRNSPNKSTHWDGVRNYRARNFMRDEMRKGDLVLFYHSNCEIPAVVGIAEVSKEAYPDPTSWDPKSKYFDPKSTVENPRWFMVDITWKEELKRPVSLQEMKETPGLQDMLVVQRGQRLSVQPVSKEHFERVRKMGLSD